MANEYGDGGPVTVSMDGPFGSADATVKTAEIALLPGDWKNGESPYTQTVQLEGISTKSKIDLQPAQEQVAKLGKWGTALTVCNSSGVITVYAIGGKPDAAMVISATITEVAGEAAVWGNTVGADVSGYVDLEKAEELIATAVKESKDYTDARHILVDVSLPVSGWTGDAPPYVQTIAVDGILPTDRPHFGVAYTDNWKAEKEEFTVVDELDTEAGRLIFTCYEEKPVVDLNIQVEVNR